MAVVYREWALSERAFKVDRLIPIGSLPTKPRKNEPCNGCGYCCAEVVCEIGRIAFETDVAPCPGLLVYESQGVARCGLVELEIAGAHEPIIQRHLGIGRGCCSDDPED